MKDLRSENDNLSPWRKKRAMLTEQLMEDALKELIKLEAKIDYKTVCNMMEKLASNEHKEFNALIKSSAISKNQIYKNMVSIAKEKAKSFGNKQQNYKTDGDKQLEVFQLKTVIAKKEAKIKELESIIDRANIVTNNFSTFNNLSDQINFKSILNDLVDFTIKDGSAFIDSVGNLVTEDNHNILISKRIIDTLEVKA